VTTDRCPGCAAAVTPGAPWCTLCYADLRVPAATATPQPVVQPMAEYAPSTAAIPQLTPAGPPPHALAPDALAPDALAPDPILDAPVAKAAPIARVRLAGWPCLGCGSVVPMDDNVCTGCGRPFLPSDAAPSLALPVVGDIARMDRSQRIVVTIVAALLVMGLFVAVAFVAGSIL
jgi:hypothetical protein